MSIDEVALAPNLLGSFFELLALLMQWHGQGLASVPVPLQCCQVTLGQGEAQLQQCTV